MDTTPGLGPIRWQHYTHEQMWQMVENADPETMFTEGEKLRELANELGEATTLANRVAQDVLGAWDGQAANTAAGHINDFLTWADTTANTANNIAGLLSQYAHVVNRARLSMPYPVQAGALTPQNQTATPEQAAASKTEAVHVMEHYASQSRTIYTELHQHQFTTPPSATGMPLPPPSPEPHPPVQPPPPAPGSTTPPSTTPSDAPPSTTPSDFAGSAAGGAIPGIPAGGVATGGPGIAAGGGGVVGVSLPGPGAMSAVGARTAAEDGVARVAGAAVEEPAGWNGFAPMAGGGRRSDEDAEHGDRYAGRPDLIGELPPAFPPVLGL
ncbi:MAG TPA: PPE domain-containing protein [Pseudonocardiaceae bacterium]|jgi:hypothetical protein|nr:PPE domain-containing protein [Pseudonocardiaceae bacterium]